MGRVLLLLLIVWTDTIVLVWGLAMAAYKVKAPLNDLAFQSTVFAFGATLLHSTACVINDTCDVDFDRQLGRCYEASSLDPKLISACHRTERTQDRPLASGRISMPGAWILLFAMTAGCYFLLSFANPIAYVLSICIKKLRIHVHNFRAFVGIFAIFPFHTLYPLMKRWTWWPQAWLGKFMLRDSSTSNIVA